jgi:chemotaxis protein MotB
MAKKVKHEEEEKLERWLVSYADFITLLFAFFTVMYALSIADKSKYEKAAESIQKAFLSSGGIFPLQGSPFTPFEKAPDQGSETPPTPLDQGKFSKDQKAMDRTKENIRKLFQRTTGLSLRAGEIDVYKTETGFKIRLDEGLLFSPNADRIKRSNIPFLYEMGKRLSRLGLQVQIEGYGDQSESRNGEDAWKLSLNRSYNVMRFMVEAVGFPKTEISVSGYGDTRPLASAETAEGRAKNRRVEIGILSGGRDLSSIDF